MAVSYKKMFKLMIDHDMKGKDLKEKTGLSYGTIAKLEKGENVQMEVLEKICKEFKCQLSGQLSDIAEIVFDE
jgi:DNA-binding Xre family transcriptional regulator